MRNKAIGEGGRKVQKIFLNKMGHKKKTSHQHFDVVIAFQLISMNKCANDFKDNLSETL